MTHHTLELSNASLPTGPVARPSTTTADAPVWAFGVWALPALVGGAAAVGLVSAPLAGAAAFASCILALSVVVARG